METTKVATPEPRAQEMFELGAVSLAASNGKFYLCTEHYGQSIKIKGHPICGKVKLANPPKKVEFFELPFMTEAELDEYLADPDTTVDYTNTRHLYWRIKELFPDVVISLSKGRIYVNGYKIAWRKLGYEIYDRYRKRAINEQGDNSDYWNSDLVLPLIEDSPTEDRMEAIRNSAEKTRRTIFLKSYKEYKEYVAGKKKDDASPVVEYKQNVTDPRELFMDDLRDHLDGLLPRNKVLIRFKKRTKEFKDSGRRLLKFMVYLDKFSGAKMSRKSLLDETETLLY